MSVSSRDLPAITRLSTPLCTRFVLVASIIRGTNDSEANIAATAEFLSKVITVQGTELLPYHRLGMSKYRECGMES
ncbi:MAG: hypothetical protein ACE14L_04430 [Terriglobales bacterium]